MSNPAKRASDATRSALLKKFEDCIDVSDVSEHLKEAAKVTRGLSAAYVSDRFGLSPEIAATHVTDGADDGGLDSITVHPPSHTIVFTQAKFSENTSKGVEYSDYLKFREGVSKILKLDFSSFNKKIRSLQSDIEDALQQIDYSIDLVLLTNSEQECSNHILKDIQKFLNAENAYQEEFAQFKYLGLTDVSGIAKRLVRPQNIQFSGTLRNFGRQREPVDFLYGLMASSELAELHNQHKDSLFYENVRFFLGSSSVNEGIIDTVQTHPEYFPYFNNGITAICNSFEKAGGGGDRTDAGHFAFDGFSIVNGAQTVGSLTKAIKDDPAADPLVFVKIISVKSAPESFARQVTRYTNTQNDLQAMDFVSLDPNQERLRGEFSKIGVNYSYRRGQSAAGSVAKDEYCEVREATIAQACCQDDLRLTVYAKRNLSQLWEDIQREPYTLLFNEDVKAPQIWNRVRAMRFLNDVLDEQKAVLQGRDSLIAVHGNRFILHWIYKSNTQKIEDFENLKKGELAGLRSSIEEALDRVIDIADDEYPDAYAGNIFKNTEKQKTILELLAEG